MLRIKVINLIILIFILSVSAVVPFRYNLKNIDKVLTKREAPQTNRMNTKEVRGLGSGEIICKVVDSEGKPLSKRVTLFDNYGWSYNSKSPDSASSEIRFSGLFPGKYTLAVEGPNYEDYFYGGKLNGNNATLIDVVPGASVNIGNFVYDESIFIDDVIMDTITISGKIGALENGDTNYYSGNFWISFEKIVDDKPGSFGSSLIFTSNESGEFTREVKLRRGEYLALLKSVKLDNKDFSPLWLDGKEITEDSDLISTNSDISGLNLFVKRGGAIFGNINDEEGKPPFEYISVQCINSEGIIFDEKSLYSSDSTVLFEGLPEDDYYIKVDNGFLYYFDNWYYPGTLDIKSAQLISVKRDKVDTISFNLKNKDGIVEWEEEAVVSGEVKYPDGTAAESYSIVVNYDNMSMIFSESSGGSKYYKTVDANRPFKLNVLPRNSSSDAIYLSGEWYDNVKTESEATSITLSPNDTLNYDVTFDWAGSIAGFIKDKDDKHHKSADIFDYLWEENEFNWGITMATNISTAGDMPYSYFSILSENIDGGYRLYSILSGKYNVISYPYFVGLEKFYGEFKQLRPTDITGPGFMKQESVEVKDTTTTILDFNYKKHNSGIINGIYKAPGKYRVNDMYSFYAVDTAGEIQSISWIGADLFPTNSNKSDLAKVLGEDLDGLIQKENNEINNSITSSIFLSRLSNQDYYVMVVFYDDITDENYLHWYGSDSIQIMEDDYSLDFLKNLPVNAKKITLPTDSSVVTIDFNSTPITKNKISSFKLMSNFNVFKNRLKFNYRLAGNDAKEINVKLVNLTGRTIYNKNYSGKKGSVVINASKENFASGVYVLKIKAGNKTVSHQFSFIK